MVYKGINPGEDIIVTDQMAGTLLLKHQSIIESCDDFLPLYYGVTNKPKTLRGKKVLLYRSSGVGDQLIWASLPKALTELFGAQCFELCDEMHEDLWGGNPYIQGMPVRFPMQAASFFKQPGKGKPFYDWVIACESATEWITSNEQGNIYDHIFRLSGYLDPEKTENRFKRPYWAIVSGDIMLWRKWKIDNGLSDDVITEINTNTGEIKFQDAIEKNPRRYIAYQLNATNITRTPPAHVLDILLNRLNQIGLPILVLDDKPVIPEIAKIINQYDNCRIVTDLPSVRIYGTCICESSLAVGPDSSIIHFAAVYNVPCIGAFGSFSPDSRVRYYRNHYPLFYPDLCDHSPCYNYAPHYPIHKCPRGDATQYCEVFNGITHEEADRVISEVCRNHKISA